MNYVLVPADKAANNVVVVWQLYYINTLKRELIDTDAYKLQPSLSERVIVDGHGCHRFLDISAPNKLGPWQTRPLTNSAPTNSAPSKLGP